ncbi:AAA family ATPase [Patescibacteria group bacterium]|nr:AAA family ATPase [Patescibacteria group bacterium]
MTISKIQLSNFRNIRDKVFEFSPKTTIIVGENASGKTNILEALFLLSTGKSFKAKLQEEMISYTSEIARVKGQVVSSKQYGSEVKKTHATNYMLHTTDLEVVLTRGEITIGENPKKKEKTPKKKMLVNKVSRRLIDFAGNFTTVLFAPEHLDIVTESPSVRRNFLDTVLSQTDREYRRAILSYEKGLRQRNRLLFRIREEGLSRSQLMFWNQLLIKNGDYVSSARQNFIEFANGTDGLNHQIFSLEYDRSAISEARLEQYAREEIATATTLVGPHRDDFVIKLKANGSKLKVERDLARFGSRGEQRMGTLWLKLAELSYIEKKVGAKPTFLLDDIFSELDHEHRDIVMDVVRGGQIHSASSGQAIITTADPHFIENFKGVERISL